jgi:hypothetical protein
VQFVIPDGVAFVLRVPAAARECFSWHHQWRDANGSLVRDGVLGNFEFGKDNPLRAPAGRYTLCVIDARGAKTSTTFDLRASDPPQIVELPLPAK